MDVILSYTSLFWIWILFICSKLFGINPFIHCTLKNYDLVILPPRGLPAKVRVYTNGKYYGKVMLEFSEPKGNNSTVTLTGVFKSNARRHRGRRVYRTNEISCVNFSSEFDMFFTCYYIDHMVYEFNDD